MKKGKKTLKGMTLIEIIITIAILAMLCVILAMVGANIDATARATNNLKDKVVKESPYAANKVTQFIDHNRVTGTFVAQTATVVVRVDDAQVNLNATIYDTEQIVLDGRSAKERQIIQNGPNNGLNLQFIDVQPTTTTTAPAEPAPADPDDGD
jgi:prepilin-type N-terminal cleavage/methylation domain-containing protein